MSADIPFGNPNAADDEVFELSEEEQEALDGAEDRFKMDEGAYRARVVDLELSVSKAGNRMWVWTWAIVKGEYEGRELKLWTALTTKAMFKLREVVEALGVWKPGQKLRIVPNEYMSKEALIHVVMDEYNGRESPKIQKVEACEAGPSAAGLDGGYNPQTGNDEDIPF